MKKKKLFKKRYIAMAFTLLYVAMNAYTSFVIDPSKKIDERLKDICMRIAWVDVEKLDAETTA